MTSFAPTFADRMAATSGRTSGFDYMRLLLSVTVVLLHGVIVSYGQPGDAVFWDTPLRPVYRLVLPMFFVLSGYLVAGSLERSRTLGMFLGLRVIRIYPALTVEVLLSAFILGPWMTSLGLRAYFGDPQFRHYLLNIFGDIHYLLPGVFAENPLPLLVNGQLWTVPYELLCYVGLTGLVAIGVVRHRYLSLWAVAVMTLALIVGRLYKYGGAFPESRAAFPGSLLVISFVAGVAIYLYRDRVVWHGGLCALALVVAVLLLGVVPSGEYASPMPIAYVTVYLGLTNVRRVGVLRHADLSYGIFLYGFVVQQAVAHMLPWSHHWALNVAIALPLTIGVAALSWTCVERPALGLRRVLYVLEDRYLRRRARGALLESSK